MGDAAQASEIFKDAIGRNPDNDQNYLSLALLEFRGDDVADAKQTCLKAKPAFQVPERFFGAWDSLRLSRETQRKPRAELERAVDLAARVAWRLFHCSGVFYFQTGTD